MWYETTTPLQVRWRGAVTPAAAAAVHTCAEELAPRQSEHVCKINGTPQEAPKSIASRGKYLDSLGLSSSTSCVRCQRNRLISDTCSRHSASDACKCVSCCVIWGLGLKIYARCARYQRDIPRWCSNATKLALKYSVLRTSSCEVALTNRTSFSLVWLMTHRLQE